MKRYWVAWVASAGLSACALFHSRPAPYPTGIMFPLTQSDSLEFPGEILETLAQEENRLYFVTRPGIVFCVDAVEKKMAWEFKMDASGDGRVVMGRDGIYVWDTEGTVYGLDREGNLKWHTPLSKPIPGAACEGEAHLYQATESGELLALDRRSGRPVWSYQGESGISAPPVCADGIVVFGCRDGTIQFVTAGGRPRGRFELEGSEPGALLIHGDRLFFGVGDQHFYCVGIRDRKRKWRARTGGGVEGMPVTDGRRLFVISKNNVISCFDRSSGTLLWWNPLPARSPFRPILIQDKVAATTLSSRLVCFDVETGQENGRYAASLELRSNPVWVPPYLIVSHFDRRKGEGLLSFLGKDVKVTLTFSKASPQMSNEEITVTALATGFYRPQYEFHVTRHMLVQFGLGKWVPVRIEEARRVVQSRSEKSTWTWFPEEPGLYVIGVQVIDEKEDAATETWFRIQISGPVRAPTVISSKGENHAT